MYLEKIKKLTVNNLHLIILLFIVTVVSLPFIRSGYFSHQDDLQIIRLVEMRKCFADFQIPCRWVPDMGWGNGFPLFNFYGVSVYYLGGLLSYFFGFIGSAKILFFLALTVGSIGIYLLVNSLWGKYAGFASAALYLLAPYKALDIYVRGALSESFSLALIPFVFYFIYKKNFSLFIVGLFLFLITHNIMTVIFLPTIFLWVFYVLALDNFKYLKKFAISFLIAFGLSAFFIVPAFFEKNLVQTESLTRFELDFRANFVSFKKIFFDRNWGYGTSIPGPEGEMYFQVGYVHWLVVVAFFISLFFKNIKSDRKIIFIFSSLFIFSVFMMHVRSSFIWEKISLLSFFQFPWRFLSLSIFTASIIGGYLAGFLNNKRFNYFLSLIIMILAFILNFNYFKPREIYLIKDEDKLSGSLWEAQIKGALLDYLPKTALEPREKAPDKPLVIQGKALISDFVNQSNRFKFTAIVFEDSKIEIPVFYFPNWTVYVNNKKHYLSYDNYIGRVSVELERGEYNVEGVFKNTPIRTASNLITFLSFLALTVLIIKWKK